MKISSRVGHVVGTALEMLNWFELSCWPVCSPQMEGRVNQYPMGQLEKKSLYLHAIDANVFVNKGAILIPA